MASALYLDRTFFGSRRMAVTLGVGCTRIRRMMRILAIEAHYPKRNLSRPVPGQEIYPYLLRGVSIARPNQVWSTDITYLPIVVLGNSIGVPRLPDARFPIQHAQAERY